MRFKFRLWLTLPPEKRWSLMGALYDARTTCHYLEPAWNHQRPFQIMFIHALAAQRQSHYTVPGFAELFN